MLQYLCYITKKYVLLLHQTFQMGWPSMPAHWQLCCSVRLEQAVISECSEQWLILWIQNIEFSPIFSQEFISWISWIHVNEIRFMNSDWIQWIDISEFIYLWIYTFEFIYLWIHILMNSYIHFTNEFTCIWIHIYVNLSVSWIHIWVRVYPWEHLGSEG